MAGFNRWMVSVIALLAGGLAACGDGAEPWMVSVDAGSDSTRAEITLIVGDTEKVFETALPWNDRIELPDGGFTLVLRVRSLDGEKVGCGIGNMTSYFLGLDEVVGLDRLPSSVRYVRAAFADRANVHICEGDITTRDTVAQLAGHRLDTVMCLNVLEHIERDQVALVNMRALLRPGGSLILVVPAHRWLYGSMDAAIGHLRRYTRRSMAELLAAAGLTPVRLQYVNAIGALGWLVAGRVLHCEAPSPSLLRRFNALVPPLRWIESKISPPFGISLLVIAQ